MNKSALNKEVGDFQSTGMASDQLVDMLAKMFNGICHRYGNGLDCEDISQECFVYFFARWGTKIDNQGDSFNFLTTCCINVIRGIRRHKQRHKPISLLNELQAEIIVAPALGCLPMVLGKAPDIAAYRKEGKLVVATERGEIPLAQFCKERQLNYNTMKARIRSGWNPHKAATRPVGNARDDWQVEGVTLHHYCRKCGINYNTIKSRMYRGMALEEALAKAATKP